MDERTEKWCSKCGADRPLAEFHRNRSKPDGLQAICKACMKKCPSQQSRRPGKLSDRVCIVCEQPFKGQPKAQYCGRECQQRSPWHLIKRRFCKVWFPLCDGCEQRRAVRTEAASRRRYCSGFCARKHQTGSYRVSKSGKVPGEVVRAVLEYYGERCAYCGSEELDSLDHMVPRSKGGKDEFANLVPVCKPCNSHKTWRTVEEWEAALLRDIEEMTTRLAIFKSRVVGIRRLKVRKVS